MSITTRAGAAAARVNDENVGNLDALHIRPKAAKPTVGSRRALGDVTNNTALGFHAKKPGVHTADSVGGVLSLAAATKIRRTVSTKAVSNSAATRRAKAAALANAVKKEAMFMDSAVNSPMSTTAVEEPPKLHPSVPDHHLLPAGVVNIDAEDVGNHLSECGFAAEIHRNMLGRECHFMASPNYMDAQIDITVKMRAILIDWLVDVHLKFKLQPETLHLTINIIDRFLEVVPVLRRKLQLVGVTAMLISSKYEEIYAPETADFVYISDKAYSKEEILEMEALILNKLSFCVTVPSSLTFLRRTLKASRICQGGDDMRTAGHLAQYCVELALQDASMLRFRPSERAAAACFLATKLVYPGCTQWTESMRYHSGDWDAEELQECELHMRRLLENEKDPNNTNKLTAIKRKYSSSKFLDISTYAADLDLTVEAMDICSRD